MNQNTKTPKNLEDFYETWRFAHNKIIENFSFFQEKLDAIAEVVAKIEEQTLTPEEKTRRYVMALLEKDLVGKNKEGKGELITREGGTGGRVITREGGKGATGKRIEGSKKMRL